MSRFTWIYSFIIGSNFFFAAIAAFISGTWWWGVMWLICSVGPTVLALGAFRDGQKCMADYVISRLDSTKPPTG